MSSATVNAEAERASEQVRFGVPTGTLDDGGTEILRAFPEGAADPQLDQRQRRSAALNWQDGKWRLSSTGNAEFSHSVTRTDNGPDLSDIRRGSMPATRPRPARRSWPDRHAAARPQPVEPLLAGPRRHRHRPAVRASRGRCQRDLQGRGGQPATSTASDARRLSDRIRPAPQQACRSPTSTCRSPSAAPPSAG